MSIEVKCTCKHRCSARRKRCPNCGAELDKLKNRGRLRYVVEWRTPDGKKARHTCSTYAEAAALDGEKKDAKIKGKVSKLLPDSRSSFQDLTDWYLGLEKTQELAEYKNKTKQGNLKRFNDHFGAWQPVDLKKSALENFQVSLKKEGLSPSYIDAIIGAARTMVKAAWDDDMIAGDCLKPFNKTKRKLKNINANARDAYYTYTEYKLLVEKAPAHIKPVIALAYYTGMRRGEILALEWSMVDLKKTQHIYLPESITKTDRAREIPVSDPLKQILDKLPRGLHDDHVILRRGKPLKDIRTACEKAWAAAGIEWGRTDNHGERCLHDFRQTFATNMRRAGVDREVIKRITGHETDIMFSRYNFVDDSDTRIAMKQFQAYVDKFELVDEDSDLPTASDRGAL